MTAGVPQLIATINRLNTTMQGIVALSQENLLYQRGIVGKESPQITIDLTTFPTGADKSLFGVQRELAPFPKERIIAITITQYTDTNNKVSYFKVVDAGLITGAKQTRTYNQVVLANALKIAAGVPGHLYDVILNLTAAGASGDKILLTVTLS